MSARPQNRFARLAAQLAVQFGEATCTIDWLLHGVEDDAREELRLARWRRAFAARRKAGAT